MANSKACKHSVLIVTTLLIACLGFSNSAAQLSGATVMSVPSAGDASVVPVKIDTFGDAWNGYLAFGLWHFNSSNLSPLGSSLDVMTTDGQLLYLRRSNDLPSYWPVKYISPDTLMFMGEPDSLATHFWNMKTNKTTDFPSVWGHHDIEYNPVTHTFLTFRDYIRVIDGHQVLMDHIYELNSTGGILWSWDTYADGHFSLKDECPCNDTTASYQTATSAGQVLIDLTHSNSLQWIYDKNIIYFNMRAQNTFCKIDKTISRTIWCLGEHGNFALFDQNGNKVPSLWYHSHDVREVQPNVFLMFDNDYHNTTKPCQQSYDGTSSHSRMLEVTVNEQNMTARTTWSWTAPSAYWTPYWGSVDILPNGDLIGAFGAQTHYVPNTLGAEVVEVNPKGDVVRTYTFPYGLGIYRVTEIALQTTHDYDGTWHVKDFKINLSTANDLGGFANTYYKINNGPTRSFSTDGQPTITAEGANNTLEYWSVDKTGIEEIPHKTLTGIELDKNPPNISIDTPLNHSQIGASTATVAWTGSDETSGIGRYEIRLDSGLWTSVGTDTTHVFTGLADGNHIIEVRALDMAGNESELSVNFTVTASPTGPGWTEYAAVLGFLAIIAIGAGLYLFRVRRSRRS
jgi:Arylsulfotransferase (ASST)